MRLEILKQPSLAPQAHNGEHLPPGTDSVFGVDTSEDFRNRVARMAKSLRRYDVQGMNRVASVLMWGRSGSFLLSSYLDGHEDVLMLPESSGYELLEYYEKRRELPLRQKLLGYATLDHEAVKFFQGDFAISPVEYQAAVQAIVESYGDCPPEFLESRRAFFLFVHIAYNLALGRDVCACPLIVFAQHLWDNRAAQQLAEDFPEARFIHTVRDPISSCDAVFHYHLDALGDRFLPLPYTALVCLVDKDRPHTGMESRTRTIRFEDLHSDPDGTMRGLALWLRIPYRPTLLASTFNGIPYVISRDGKTWSGRRVEQLQRLSRHLSPLDRAFLCALLYQNFAEWNYPFPKAFRNPSVRFIVFISLFLVPMRTEFIAARVAWKCRILPSLKKGNLPRAATTLLSLVFCRARIIRLVTPVFLRRATRKTTLLEIGQAEESVEQPAARAHTI